MRRTSATVLTALFLVACGDTDVEHRESAEIAPGEEVEELGLQRDVEPVDLDTTAWLSEGRTVEFAEREWLIVGEPVYDPAVEYVGMFEETPLYAEVGVAAPYTELFIPLPNDYWQRLEPATSTGTAPAPTAEPGEGVEGDATSTGAEDGDAGTSGTGGGAADPGSKDPGGGR